MADPTPTLITVDPNTPPGTEPLKKGPARFHEIKEEVLQMFGMDPTTQQTFAQPFFYASPDQNTALVSVFGDPTTDLGIVPKRYADGKVSFAANVNDPGGNGHAYVGSTTPSSLSDPPTDSVVVIKNTGGTNTGPVTLQFNGASILPLVNFDGSALAPGAFQSDADYLIVNDGDVTYRILGSTVTTAYADTIVNVATQQLFTGPTTLSGTPASLFGSISIPIPTDGRYMIFVETLLYFVKTEQDNTNVPMAWAQINGQKFCVCGVCRYGLGSGGTATDVLTKSGFSPAAYDAGTTVTLEIFGVSSEGGAAKAAPDASNFTGTAPPAFVSYALIRSS